MFSHPYQCVRIPANCRTFQELQLKFPGLYRTKIIFQDFPGLEILQKNTGTKLSTYCLRRRHNNCRLRTVTMATAYRRPVSTVGVVRSILHSNRVRHELRVFCGFFVAVSRLLQIHQTSQILSLCITQAYSRLKGHFFRFMWISSGLIR